jgi:hypothetical protein
VAVLNNYLSVRSFLPIHTLCKTGSNRAQNFETKICSNGLLASYSSYLATNDRNFGFSGSDQGDRGVRCDIT